MPPLCTQEIMDKISEWPTETCVVCHYFEEENEEKDPVYQNGLCTYCRSDLSEESMLALKLMCVLPPDWQKWFYNEKMVDYPPQPGFILRRGEELPAGNTYKRCLGNLAIGDIEDVLWGENSESFTHVFDCCPERLEIYAKDFAKAQFVHVLVPMDDHRLFPAVDYLRTNHVTQQLVALLNEGHDVVVNCWAGCNRSACLCIHALLLMQFEVKEAYMMVRQARGCILTNHSFSRQLVMAHQSMHLCQHC